MTWIRWDVNTADSEVVAFLAERLGLKPVHALGYYNALCCGFGMHRKDGNLGAVTDTALEVWARWDGKRGKFAEAIRAWCAEPMPDGTPRPPGELRGWWRQRALLAKQERDAQKPDGRKGRGSGLPRESRAGSAGDSRGMLGGNDNDNGDGDEYGGRSPLRSDLPPAVAPAVRLALAANAGLRANPTLPEGPHGRAFRELLPNQAQAMATAWAEAGIPLALAEDVVRQVASAYVPQFVGDQIGSFQYFDRAVRAAHLKAQGTAELNAAGSSNGPQLSIIRIPRQA